MKLLMTFAMRYFFLTAELPLVYTDCNGIFNFPPCCVGEKMDESNHICTKCPRGLYGDNCTHTCEVPYFGHRCVLGRCTCTRDSCNIPPSICSPTADTDVSRSTILPESAMITTDQQDIRTSVTPSSVKPGTRDEDQGPRGSAAPYLVYIIPITCTLTVFLLTVLRYIFCYKGRQLICSSPNKNHQIDSDYELTVRVYENNGSTNCYDTPDTNTNISSTQGASESSYESVELFPKDL